MRALAKQTTATVACAFFAGCGGLSTESRPIPDAAPAYQSARACHGWRVVPSGNGSSVNTELYGVTRGSGSTLWAVGNYENQSGGPFLTLSQRWDGKSWSVLPSPNEGAGGNGLYGVAAVSDSDVWAVGDRNATSTARPKPLIEHWNGSAWSIVKSPSAGQLSVLGAVAAVSSNDVWAAGSFFNFAGNQQTLIEHWNGSKWSIVKSPSPGASYNGLGNFAVVSPKDIWTTGSSSSDGGNTSQTLVERWNGKQWSLVSSPNVPGSVYNGLGSIALVNAHDLWAVGESESAPTYATRTLIEQWNGSQWNIVSSPNMGSLGNGLSGIAAGSGSDLWAVGSYFELASGGIDRTLIERWNGSAWTVVKSPSPGNNYDELRAITSNSVGFWTVGVQGGESLVEFHCS